MNTTFAALVLKALMLWTHGSIPSSDLEPWAGAAGDVCMSPRECIQLAALAYEETRFVAWAVDQRCNDAAWRAAHQMQRVCDGGRAFGPWQVQDTRFAGASPEFQASVALEIMRRRMSAWTTWRAAIARTDWTLRTLR